MKAIDAHELRFPVNIRIDDADDKCVFSRQLLRKTFGGLPEVETTSGRLPLSVMVIDADGKPIKT